MKTILLTWCSTLFIPHAAVAGYLGVVNKADGSLSLIHTETGHTEQTIDVGYFPHETITSLDGTKIFVSDYGKDHVRSTSPSNRPGNTLSVIDARKFKKLKDITLGSPACAPHGMAPSPDGKRIYVTCEDRQEIIAVDIESGKILNQFPTQQPQSHMLVVAPDESRAYVTNFSAGTVTAIDLKQKSILKQLMVGPGTEGIGLSADGLRLYATSVLSNTLVVIDTQSLEIIGSANTDRSPLRVLPVPDRNLLLVNNSAAGTVQVFDATTLQMVARIKVGQQPIGIVVPNSKNAYVANMRDNTISAIDLDSRTVTGEWATGNRPDGVTYIP